MKQMLISGASGFIGRALCQAAVENGYHVSAVVRRADCGANACGNMREIVIGEITSSTNWEAALAGIDVVVHLAARAHVLKETASVPLEAYREINVRATERLARMAATAGVRRFVFLSSIGVNGEQTFDKPFSEADPPRPRRDYAVSKWEAETALRCVSDETGMEHVILRPPLVYGPGVKGNMRALLDYIYKGAPLPFGALCNRRSLIGLDNLVDIILISAHHAAAKGQTYLVSDGTDVSTAELIRLLSRAMHKEPRLLSIPTFCYAFAASLMPPLRAKVIQLTGSLVIDSGKVRSELSWTPPQSLQNGIQRMVDHYMLGKDIDRVHG